VAEVDLAFPELKIAIEVDGGVHLLEEVHERDLPRQNQLVLLGGRSCGSRTTGCSPVRPRW
jgi:very-short-patch-repair endonuclease